MPIIDVEVGNMKILANKFFKTTRDYFEVLRRTEKLRQDIRLATVELVSMLNALAREDRDLATHYLAWCILYLLENVEHDSKTLKKIREELKRAYQQLSI